MSVNKGLYKLHSTNLVCNKLKHKIVLYVQEVLFYLRGTGGLFT